MLPSLPTDPPRCVVVVLLELAPCSLNYTAPDITTTPTTSPPPHPTAGRKLTWIAYSLQGHGNGHHHDRASERRQNIIAASPGGERS